MESRSVFPEFNLFRRLSFEFSPLGLRIPRRGFFVGAPAFRSPLFGIQIRNSGSAAATASQSILGRQTQAFRSAQGKTKVFFRAGLQKLSMTLSWNQNKASSPPPRPQIAPRNWILSSDWANLGVRGLRPVPGAFSSLALVCEGLVRAAF